MPIQNSDQLRLLELRFFQAVMENQSITAAAEALGVSQSRVSKQLKLMRTWFGDDLFVRTGHGMEATSKALSIAPKIKELIAHFELINCEMLFDPLNIERDLVISTTDELEHFLMPQLIERIQAGSPKSRLVFRALERDYAAKQLELGSVDLVISPNWNIPEHLKQKRVYTDDFVVIFRQGHPLEKKKLTVERYLAARHLMVSPRGTTVGPIDESLSALGHKRLVSVTTPYFMNANDALLNTDLISTLQRRACNELVKYHPLVIRPFPLEIPAVNYFLFWHKRFNKDSVNCWLRDIVYEILRGQVE